jgi:ketosteroid isomerase-like protein
MTRFSGLSAAEAAAFAAEWLPAWTGNDPDRLLSFYTEDAFYRDPAVPQGISGRASLRRYLAALLAQNPDWVWTQAAATPLEGGFLNHWRARIPVGPRTIEAAGVCTVVLREGRIARNEVFFDRCELLAAWGEKARGRDFPQSGKTI